MRATLYVVLAVLAVLVLAAVAPGLFGWVHPSGLPRLHR